MNSWGDGLRSVQTVLCSVIAVLVFALEKTAAHANPITYPRLHLDTSAYSQPADDVLDFIAKIRSGFDRGLFEAESPSVESEDFDGKKPKVWLVSRVSPAFECHRDFGGMCASVCEVFEGDICPEGWSCHLGHMCKIDDPDASVRNFLRTFGESVDDVGASYDGELSADALGKLLDPVSFDLSSFSQSFSSYDDVACTSELWFRDLEAFDQAEAMFDDELSAHYSFIGVRGAWNVRSNPSIRSTIVGRANDEALYFPEGLESAILEQLEDGTAYTWNQVNLHSGQTGYIATPMDDLVLSDLWGGACVQSLGGEVFISAHVGGGD